MRKSTRITGIRPFAWVVTALLLGTLAGCGGEDEGAREVIEETREQVDSGLEEARDRVETELETLERRIDDLRRDIGEASEEVRQEWSQRVDDLEERAAGLRRDLESMRDRGEDAWNAFAARARRAMEEIREGLDEAAEELG